MESVPQRRQDRAIVSPGVSSHFSQLACRGIPVGLIVLAFAQIGIHLVFFLHLGTGTDSTAFGLLIVLLIIAGSVWIGANLNSNMPMSTQ